MNCTYCGTRGYEGEHRCRRCGRRLNLDTVHAAPNPYPVTRGSVAPDLAVRQMVSRDVVDEALSTPPENRPVRQQTLFPTQVLRFEDFAPSGHVEEKPKQKARTSTKPRKQRPTKKEKLEAAGQQTMNFMAAAAPARPVTKTGVEPSLYCGHPVALPIHRLWASALDVSMVLSGLGVFVAVFYAAGGAIALNPVTTPFYAAAALAIALFYRALWWIADGDTPGLAWCRLQVLNFHGERPTPRDRLVRFAGACLSLASGGLGFLWSVGDEEMLGWHDHISRTFPSPLRTEPTRDAEE